MEKPSNNNTICWYPFYQLSCKGWLTGVGPTSITPCCNMARPGIEDPMQNNAEIRAGKGNFTTGDIFYSKEFTNLRNDMLAGKKPPACKVCWDKEELSGRSYRYGSANVVNSVSSEVPVINVIDLDIGENCNLRCRMCSPGSSNKLRTDRTYFNTNGMTYMTVGNKMWGWDGNQTNTSAVDYFDVDNQFYRSVLAEKNLIRIKAAGGEPLLSESWTNWVDAILVDKEYAASMTVECHTNATKFSKENINRLLHFKNLHIVCSIDATHKAYEYIRFPMTWHALDNNISAFVSSVPANKMECINISSVMSVYSVFDINSLVSWSINLLKKSNAQYLYINFDTVFPDKGNLDIVWLPDDLLLVAIENIKKALAAINETPNVKSNLNNMLTILECNLNKDKPKHKQLEMKREITAFDKSRNQSYADYLDINFVNWLNSLDCTELNKYE